MTEPKLPTEAEVLSKFDGKTTYGAEPVIRYLRERDLIAPEPVDPVRLMAVQIMDYLNPQGDEQDINWVVNTILRPSIDALELAERPTLTWKMVREACNAAYKGWHYTDDFVDALHAALLERLK